MKISIGKVMSFVFVYFVFVIAIKAQKKNQFDVLQDKKVLVSYNPQNVVIIPRGYYDTYIDERASKKKENSTPSFGIDPFNQGRKNWNDPSLRSHFKKIGERADKKGTMAHYVRNTLGTTTGLVDKFEEMLTEKGNQVSILKGQINAPRQGKSSVKLGKFNLPTQSSDYQYEVLAKTKEVRKALRKQYGIAAEPSEGDYQTFFEKERTNGEGNFVGTDILMELDIVPLIEGNYKTAIIGVSEYKPQNQPQVFLRVEMKVHDVKNNLTLFENTDTYSFTILKSDESAFVDNYKEINKNFKNLKWKYNEEFYPYLDLAVDGLYNVYISTR